MRCKYCLSENQSGANCDQCGAPLSKPKPITEQDWKSEPFFYNGFICYQLRHFERDAVEIQFWLGRELIERIELPTPVLKAKFQLYEDPMPFFWDLFRLAHGEVEVLEYQEKNNKYPARFEVRRIENPEIERWSNMKLQDVFIL